ncbi:type I-E CRISPR-associated protein Cse1/CasA [Herbidospora sp. NEAU-GS84]|uniref:Type I-E CRISPR-associated protein Cse1/CasA n=1 Tax=Herbidospora solisilvae TaxID=2696284 RepID=A0A7C9JT36_9ACTN|nr:type I-E CRISPR-associated protein Cse1/CasA [Herbidospora solisilvae]NAS22179.1 type I-E CRISPR-associated protein Cse1/CasA [Herbidospora solisilvae]
MLPDRPYSCDLLTYPWLPIPPGGSVGLRELYVRAHEIPDVDAPFAPAGAALWRILTVIAARITGLDRADNINEWQDRRDGLLDISMFSGNDVEKYFAQYGDRFDLFHPSRPFLQDSRLADECAKTSGINKLVLSRPAGNNQVWFDHHTDVDAQRIPVEEAVWHLLAQMYYGPSGRCTSRTVYGRSEANSTAGPLRGTISYHPLGRNVFESLVTGIPYPGPAVGRDVAVWEEPEPKNPLGISPTPGGLGGLLANRFRHAILLSRQDELIEDAWITWAWRQPAIPAEDPYLIYQHNKKGELYARGASAARALWRDLDALLMRDVGEERSRRPKVLDLARTLPFDVLDNLRVRAFGFDQDGQTRDKQWFTATTPAVLSLLLEPEAISGVSRVRSAAEEVAQKLRTALRNVWVALNDPSNGDGKPTRSEIPAGPWRDQGAAHYWPRAERLFWRKVDARDFTAPAFDFVREALEVYDAITQRAGNTPRARRAVERARGLILAARGPRLSGSGDD